MVVALYALGNTRLKKSLATTKNKAVVNYWIKKVSVIMALPAGAEDKEAPIKYLLPHALWNPVHRSAVTIFGI